MFSSRFAALLLTVVTVMGAEDPWLKVKGLKSGVELRILKKGAKQPVVARLDEATNESLIVVHKDEQVAIPKDEIERLDSRPAPKGPRLKADSRNSTAYPDRVTPAAPGQPRTGGSSLNSTSSLTIESRPDFETVYRRVAPAPPVR